jgi:hypothetical protein
MTTVTDTAVEGCAMLSRNLAMASPEQDHRESMLPLQPRHAFAVLRRGRKGLQRIRESMAHRAKTGSRATVVERV